MRRVLFIGGIILALLLAVLLLFAASSRKDNDEPQYSPNGSGPLSGPVVISFPDTISPENGVFALNPEAKGVVEKVDNYLLFWPDYTQGFVDGEEYTVSANGVRSVKGKEYPEVKFSFVINQKTPYDKLQLHVFGKYFSGEEDTDSFLSLLPHRKSLVYNIKYIIKEGSTNPSPTIEDVDLVVETLIGQGRFDTLEEHLVNVKIARSEALEWIKDQGFETSDATIIYSPTDRDILVPGSSTDAI
jgi:hypothetical protein